MLRSVKDLFDRLLPPPAATGVGADDRTPLAAAVLMVEVLRADGQSHESEERALFAALKSRFALEDGALAQLVELAQHTAQHAHDFHRFTSALNDAWSDAEKLAVVEAMWDIAYADGQLAAHENHVLWRVADLLHVPHGAYIGAKMRARERAGAAR